MAAGLLCSRSSRDRAVSLPSLSAWPGLAPGGGEQGGAAAVAGCAEETAPDPLRSSAGRSPERAVEAAGEGGVGRAAAVIPAQGAAAKAADTEAMAGTPGVQAGRHATR